MHQIIKDISRTILDAVLPVRCAACKRESKEAVCSDCLAKLHIATEQRCCVCTKQSPSGLTHDKCKTKTSPDRLLCAFQYQNSTLAEGIIVGKYKFVPDVYRVLGQAMAQVLEEDLKLLEPSSVSCTAIPLHWRRLQWRGFNQSALLAKEIASSANVDLCQALVRTHFTKVQKDLSADARRINVFDCFTLANGVSVSEKTILLIDDVTTTGSTLLEAAKVLKKAGATSVWCLALAQD